MIKEIVTDEFILQRKAKPATRSDKEVGQDLIDTLNFHYHVRNDCVGMAANMIGEIKAIIVFVENQKVQIMYNPVIEKTYGKPYLIEEGCLSRPHKAPIEVKRYDKIKVSYQDHHFRKKTAVYESLVAEIIQHECDHLQGILV